MRKRALMEMFGLLGSRVQEAAWPVPPNVDPHDWKHTLEVYEKASDFLNPPWDENVQPGPHGYQRADLKQHDYDALQTWVQEVSDFKGSHTWEYVAQTRKIEGLLQKLYAETERDFKKHRAAVLDLIKKQGFITPATASSLHLPTSLLSMVFRRMNHERDIEWSHNKKGYVAR